MFPGINLKFIAFSILYFTTSPAEQIKGMLIERLKKQNMDPLSFKEYIDGFGWVAPPYAGAGIGLGRFVSLILGLGNIRYAALFPRDPKSFPTHPPRAKPRHPEGNTLHRTKGPLPPLENLIANYGDATDTSWMDERFEVWRYGHRGCHSFRSSTHPRNYSWQSPL